MVYCSVHQVVQSSKALHSTEAIQEVARKLPCEYVKLRSKEQAAVQPVDPVTSYFRWSSPNTVLYDPTSDSDAIFIPSQSSYFSFVGQKEEVYTAITNVVQLYVSPRLKIVVNKQRKLSASISIHRKSDKIRKLSCGYEVSKLLSIGNENIHFGLLASMCIWEANTTPVTQRAVEWKYDYVNTELTCHNRLLENYTSNSHVYKRESMREIDMICAVSFTFESFRCTTGRLVPVLVFENSSTLLRGNGRVFEVEVVNRILRNGGYQLLRRIEGLGFDPGGTNVSAQLQIQRTIPEYIGSLFHA